MSDALQTKFSGIAFKNPVVLASGTCGFGREYNDIFDIERLGGICSKGLTLNPRQGNSGIRIWETDSGVMNSVGLENPGIRKFIEDDLDWLNGLNIVKIVNLSGYSIEDYTEGAELLNSVKLDIIELNISCPNIKSGGMSFGVKTDIAREVVRKIRAVCKHKLIVKLSPNAEDVTALAKACEDEGADGISMVNTFLAMAIDIRTRRPVFENIYAGLSGPAIKPVALRMVHQVSKAVKIPVMGIGGIASWQDAIEFIMAGATVVQVGTGNFIDPSISLGIIDGMRAYLDSQKIESIEEIRGCV